MVRDNLLSFIAFVLAFPIFVLRFFHYLYDRIFFPNHNAVIAVDSFTGEFKYVEA
jgi:hypothetical protein